MSLRFENRSDVRSGHRRLGSGAFLMWSGVVVAVILAWTVGTFALGGDPDSNAESAAPEKTEESVAERGEPPKDSRQAPVEGGGVPVSNRPGSPGEDHVPEDAENIGERENVGDEAALGETHSPEGGVSHEAGGYDPLGVSGQEVPLLPADKDRARAAAAQFITAAYGYTGEAGEESARGYISGVSDHALTPEFYASSGASEVKRYEELVRASGTRSAAVLDLFEIREVIPEVRSADGYTQQRVVGYAYFRTANEYDRYGGIEGDEESYRQRLTLERYRAVFKVYAAGEIEEVRE